jgi:hypothetical protein
MQGKLFLKLDIGVGSTHALEGGDAAYATLPGQKEAAPNL